MKPAIFLLILWVLPAFLHHGGTTPPVNEYVKFAALPAKKTLKPGTTTQLLFRLTPKAGIHINLKPSPDLRFDSIRGISLAGQPEIPRRDSFLDASKPITQAITLAGDLPEGPVNITGTFIYYYCSDAEGWCSRFKQPFEVKVTVAR